jgi:DNA invertase Pin-like site-specific DNA recombinase
MRRVVGYIRVSTEGQAESGLSLGAQRVKLESFALAMDLSLVGIEADEGVSAKSLDRPALQRALAMLDDGTADAVLVAKLDRLTRSVRDLGDLVDRYFASGRWSLLSVADSIDTNTAAGRLVLNVLGAVAQWEREAIAERTREALAECKRRGVRLGGEALGWTRTDAVDGAGRQVVADDDAEMETVSTIRRMRAEGASLREIATALDTSGRPTKRGGKWAPQTVAKVLSRQSAADHMGVEK